MATALAEILAHVPVYVMKHYKLLATPLTQEEKKIVFKLPVLTKMMELSLLHTDVFTQLVCAGCLTQLLL